jgi:hypothetical protein
LESLTPPIYINIRPLPVGVKSPVIFPKTTEEMTDKEKRLSHQKKLRHQRNMERKTKFTKSVLEDQNEQLTNSDNTINDCQL